MLLSANNHFGAATICSGTITYKGAASFAGGGTLGVSRTDSSYIREGLTDSVGMIEAMTDSSGMLEGLTVFCVRVSDKKLFTALTVLVNTIDRNLY